MSAIALHQLTRAPEHGQWFVSFIVTQSQFNSQFALYYMYVTVTYKVATYKVACKMCAALGFYSAAKYFRYRITQALHFLLDALRLTLRHKAMAPSPCGGGGHVQSRHVQSRSYYYQL